MKNFWSKNLLIGLLLFTNSATAAYVLYENVEFKSLFSTQKIKSSKFRNKKKNTTKAKYRKKIKPHNPSLNDNDQLQACYESYLRREPTADEGAVLFHWTINNKGWIDSISLVKSDLPDQLFTDCLKDVAKNTHFPMHKHPEGTIIAHKFKFHRRQLSSLNF